VIVTKFLCMLPMSVARSSSVNDRPHGLSPGRLFLHIDNALYSIAFGTHAKTAESIDIPFAMISGRGPTNSVLRGGRSPKRKGQFGGKCARQAYHCQ